MILPPLLQPREKTNPRQKLLPRRGLVQPQPKVLSQKRVPGKKWPLLSKEEGREMEKRKNLIDSDLEQVQVVFSCLMY
jgi:hypothetical protein